MTLGILKQYEYFLGLFIQDVWESIKQITNRNNDIGLNSKINLRS